MLRSCKFHGAKGSNVKQTVPVNFSLKVEIPVPAISLFRALTDWRDHSSWIPLTAVTITKEIPGHRGGAHSGQEFCARTGIGLFAFNDNMRVTKIDPENLSCEVEKIGPIITGRAGFTLISKVDCSYLTWYEEINLPLPSFFSPLLSPLLSFLGKIAFTISLKKLASHMRKSVPGGS